MKRIGTIIVLLMTLLPLRAQEVYRTQVFDRMVHTLQVKIADEMLSSPYIHLNGNQQIEINFDILDPEYQHFAYSIVHCDANWQPSSLIPLEYMNGFQGLPVEDFANGMGTTVSYMNYQLRLPNEEVQFKVSGNYAVRIYKEDNPQEEVLTACFHVFENAVQLSAEVTGNTLIDTNQAHQQLNFSLNTSRFAIPYPQTDLKVFVYQNNRRDNMVSNLMPSGISNNRIDYENLRELIFEAGNEYRRFEFLSPTYNGMRVEDISFHHPYYHVTVMPDESRANYVYQYDQDQDGKYLVRCRNCNEPDTQADYYIVHFTLDHPALIDGNIYLSGELTNNVLNERSRMLYNPQTGLYEKNIFLKQGHYNYQYLFQKKGEEKATVMPIEGSYYPTENEYRIHIYYRPMGERYDRLIGVGLVKSDKLL
ncbi:DUF5103 domain-containing protein [Parabacteroides sp. OttesenSCG-928-G06]|nr:DUF5103 domain-containing protein [Parabacteroides sp. OttesenSCG-928-G06]